MANTQTVQLTKSLGLADVFCISTGAMISSGIFILPGIAFRDCGPAVILAYAIAGLCALIGAFATIELATAMPLAGGIYYYTGRSLGPLAGTISGLLNWSAIALKSAFAIYGMSEVIHQFVEIDKVVYRVGLTLIFLGINLISTKAAARAQIVMVGILLLIMGGYAAMGLPEISSERFSPFFHAGNSYGALFAQAAFVFVAFGGLLDVASISEEVKDPRNNLPRGMIAATACVTVFYVLALVVTVGVLDAGALSGSFTPLADAAESYYGTTGYAILTGGALMAFVTTANAGVMAASRFPFAMGRDRLIPEFFSHTYGHQNIPLPALLVTGAAMVGVQFLELEVLVTVASTVIMLSFILTNISVIILRESGLQNYRPSFRTPGYPILPLACIALFIWLIVELGMTSVRMSLVITLAGAALYFLCGRKSNLEFALTHLIYKLTTPNPDAEAPAGGPPTNLESELREIVRARDNIVADEFDELVEHAEVHIEPERTRFVELALHVCEKHAPETRYSAEELAHLLVKRESASSTVISPGIAVPHALLEGEQDIFHLVLVKAPQGARFSEEAEDVRAAFFIFATPDRRNQHLKTLAAIAQIIQHPDFDRRWDAAQTPEQIRDLFLLAKRKRAQTQTVSARQSDGSPEAPRKSAIVVKRDAPPETASDAADK